MSAIDFPNSPSANDTFFAAGKNWIYNGSGWALIGSNVGDVITAGDTGTVTSTMIADGTIVNADINASAAIDKTKISGTAITAADTGTVTSTMIADGAIVNADVNASAAIAYSKLNLNNSIVAGDITSGAVTAAKILDSNVTTAKIADDAVTGAKLANATVETKSGSYTLVAADRNKRVVMDSASATTITVNTSLFSAGDTVVLQNIGAGTCTVTAGTATVSSAGPLAIPQYGSGTLYFTSEGVSIYFPSAVTAATVSSGLVFIVGGTITDTTSVNNCFTSTYLNYKLVINNLVSGNTSAVKLRLRASGSDNTSAVYSYINNGQNTSSGGTLDLGVGRDFAFFQLGYGNNYANGQSFSMDIFSPQTAKNTHYGPLIFWNQEIDYAGVNAGVHKSTTQFDGFTIFPTSSTLAGTYKLYGYANS